MAMIFAPGYFSQVNNNNVALAIKQAPKIKEHGNMEEGRKYGHSYAVSYNPVRDRFIIDTPNIMDDPEYIVDNDGSVTMAGCWMKPKQVLPEGSISKRDLATAKRRFEENSVPIDGKLLSRLDRSTTDRKKDVFTYAIQRAKLSNSNENLSEYTMGMNPRTGSLILGVQGLRDGLKYEIRNDGSVAQYSGWGGTKELLPAGGIKKEDLQEAIERVTP